MKFIENINKYIESTLGISPEIQNKIFNSVIAIIIILLIRIVILRVVRNRSENPKIRYQWRKATNYILFFIALLIIGRIWLKGFQSLSTYFGLLSAGIAIALKDLLSSIAGWVFLMILKPISISDRIQIGQFKGDVIDIRLFKFTLMEIGNWVDADQSTGRIIHLPNSLVLTESILNYSKGFQYIWDEIQVLITFESNWKKAKKILFEIINQKSHHLTDIVEKKVKKASTKFMIFYSKLTPNVYTSVKDSGVQLTMRYLCEPKERRSQQELIWEEILNQFAACKDIDFAYPTQRFYNNLNEGKQSK